MLPADDWPVGRLRFRVEACRSLWRWLGQRVLLLVAIAVVVSAMAGVWLLRDLADRDYRAALVTTRLASAVDRLSGLESEAIEQRLTGSRQAGADFGAMVGSVGTDLATLSELADNPELAASLRAYVAAVGAELALLRAGNIDAALSIDRSRVDPLYAELSPRLETVADEQARSARTANRNSRILSLVVVLTALAAVLVLVRRYGMARAAERESQRERDRLRELDALKDAFVATVSHELRTPLTSISGYTELLLEQTIGPLNGTQERSLRVIDRNGRRLLNVIEDLLFLSRVDAGGFELQLEPLDLDTVVGDSLEAQQPRAGQAGVTLADELEPAAVLGDRDRLAQLVDNLIANAIKFTPEGGTVTVRVGRDDAGALVSVSDTGIGIDAGDQERLFDRFYRTPQAGEHQIQGTGLGLSIAKAISDAHRGTIEVESAPCAGSTFTVRLPLAGTAASPAASSSRVATIGQSPQPAELPAQ